MTTLLARVFKSQWVSELPILIRRGTRVFTANTSIISERKAFNVRLACGGTPLPGYLLTYSIRLLSREVDFYSKFTTPLIYSKKNWKLKNRHLIFWGVFLAKSFFFATRKKKLIFYFLIMIMLILSVFLHHAGKLVIFFQFTAS